MFCLYPGLAGKFQNILIPELLYVDTSKQKKIHKFLSINIINCACKYINYDIFLMRNLNAKKSKLELQTFIQEQR